LTTAERVAATERAKVAALDPELEVGLSSRAASDVAGHTLVCEFKIGATGWKVYEDLRVRDGAITFTSSAGASRVLAKSAEATFAEIESYGSCWSFFGGASETGWGGGGWRAAEEHAA
jgi:hypothetical protein